VVYYYLYGFFFTGNLLGVAGVRDAHLKIKIFNNNIFANFLRTFPLLLLFMYPGRTSNRCAQLFLFVAIDLGGSFGAILVLLYMWYLDDEVH
jgi:hypothetical protein